MNKTNYQYKGNLKNLKFQSNVVEDVASSIINDFTNVSLIKNNVELIELICNIIEQLTATNSQKQDKEKLFFNIYDRIFQNNVSAEDKVFISNIIQFLLNNNLVKKVSMFRRLINKFKNIFSKKN
jgi:hypothetical protein